MKNTTSKITSFLLLALVLCACNGNLSQTTEISDSDSIIYASVIPPTVTDAAPPTQRLATATWYLKTATPILPTPPPDDIGYYEGIIVITQYYTFLGHGLYEEAYQLLSSSAQDRIGSLDEFSKYKKYWIKKLEIVSIVPQHSRRDSINRRRFIVSFIAWGEGRMSGAAMSGEIQTIYMTLISENGLWKIESGTTS